MINKTGGKGVWSWKWERSGVINLINSVYKLLLGTVQKKEAKTERCSHRVIHSLHYRSAEEVSSFSCSDVCTKVLQLTKTYKITWTRGGGENAVHWIKNNPEAWRKHCFYCVFTKIKWVYREMSFIFIFLFHNVFIKFLICTPYDYFILHKRLKQRMTIIKNKQNIEFSKK